MIKIVKIKIKQVKKGIKKGYKEGERVSVGNEVKESKDH